MPVRLRRRKSKGGFYLLFYFILVGFPGVILKPFLFFLLPELIIFFLKIVLSEQKVNVETFRRIDK